MARRPKRNPRQVLGELWSVRADNARAELTAAEFHAAAGRWERAAACFSAAAFELSQAELLCLSVAGRLRLENFGGDYQVKNGGGRR